MDGEQMMATTFRYPCYLDLRRSLGAFDAVCGYATIAVDFLSEELQQNPEPRDWLSRYSKSHGVTLHDVDDASLTPRLADMFVLLVYARFEEFLRSFLDEHRPSQTWEPRGDLGLFEYIVKNLNLAHCTNASGDRETIEYYRLARNAISHPSAKRSRLDNQRTKVRSMLNITEEYLPPKRCGAFDYGDFFMFTRAVKAYAAVMCQAARPSNSEIADCIAPRIKLLNRFRNKPVRFQNALRQFLRMSYHMDTAESDGVIDHVIGR
jgi:hypothetical protein